jgi:hypothetical protein
MCTAGLGAAARLREDVADDRTEAELVVERFRDRDMEAR